MVDLGAAITAAVTMLRNAGLNADADPAKVRVPGVWVTLDTVDVNRLTDDVVDLRLLLLLVAPSRDASRSLTSLGDLLATVVSVMPPTDTVTAEAVTLPDSPVPLPALAVPVELQAT